MYLLPNIDLGYGPGTSNPRFVNDQGGASVSCKGGKGGLTFPWFLV